MSNKSLLLAAKKGDVNSVNKLLDQGADINCKDDLGKSPLIQASSEGHVNVIDVLLSKGADINDIDIKGMTPLMNACENPKAFERLLREPGIDLFKVSKIGKSALGYAIDKRNRSLSSTVQDMMSWEEITEFYADSLNNSVNNVSAILVRIDDKVFNHDRITAARAASRSGFPDGFLERIKQPQDIIDLTNQQLFESEEFNNLPKEEKDLIKNIIQSKNLVLCLFKLLEHKFIFFNSESMTELIQTLLIQLPEPVRGLPPDFVDAIRKKVFTILEENADIESAKYFRKLYWNEDWNPKTKGGKRMKTRKNKKNKKKQKKNERNKQKMKNLIA